MSNKTETSNNIGGFSITVVLGIVFVTLKLLHVINWSWWWILSPFWIPAAFTLLALLIVLLVIVVRDVLKARG